MSRKELAAVFWLPEGDPRPLSELETLVGVSEGRWQGLAARTAAWTADFHRVFAVFVGESDFNARLQPDGPDTDVPRDPWVTLAADLARAGAALGADAAAFLARRHQVEGDHVSRWSIDLGTLSTNVLADEVLGALWLSDGLAEHWVSTPRRDARDSLPVQSGRLVFSGRGALRWW